MHVIKSIMFSVPKTYLRPEPGINMERHKDQGKSTMNPSQMQKILFPFASATPAPFSSSYTLIKLGDL